MYREAVSIAGALVEIQCALGCRAVHTEILPIISSRREPARREILLDYLRELLLSGTENLERSDLADRELMVELEAEFDRARRDPGIDFFYSAIRLSCHPGR